MVPWLPLGSTESAAAISAILLFEMLELVEVEKRERPDGFVQKLR